VSSQSTSPRSGIQISTCGNAMNLEKPRSISMMTAFSSIAPTAIMATHAPIGAVHHKSAAAFTGTRMTTTQTCTHSGKRRKLFQISRIMLSAP